MDFLDPRKRQAHNRRLFLGYALVAVAIILGAYILYNAARGYGVDPKTGDVIQNSLLFVSSKPDEADIYLDNEQRGSRTSARLILPAGPYTLTLRKDGYHQWQRTIVLAEQAVARYTYPLLFPIVPVTQTAKNYQTAQLLTTQTPDLRRLLTQTFDTSGRLQFDEYDTSEPSRLPRTLVAPSALLTKPSGKNRLTVIEWSADSTSILLEHRYAGGKEFILFNRIDPSASININKSLNIKPAQVMMRNQRASDLYILHSVGGRLELANLSRQTLSPLLNGVMALKSSGTKLILYVSGNRTDKKNVNVNIWNGSRSYRLTQLPVSARYHLGISQYQDHTYLVVGSNKATTVRIYKDALEALAEEPTAEVIPLVALPIRGASHLLMPPIPRFVMSQTGQKVIVYDLETASMYAKDIKRPLAGELTWLDNFRLIGNVQGRAFIMDYDLSNQQLFISGSSNSGYFDRDYRYFYTTLKDKDKVKLVWAMMRVNDD